MIALLALAGLVLAAAALAVSTAWFARAVDERYPPRGAFVELDGMRLHYVDRPARDPGADPSCPPVVLIHGATGSTRDSLVALEEALGDSYRLIAVDRPGHGWSTRRAGRQAASPIAQAAAIREGLARIGVDRAIVLGHSMGGAVALAHAIAHPEATAGLVFLAPVSHSWVGGVAWHYHVAAAPLVGPLFTRLIAVPFGRLVLERAVAGAFAPQEPPEDFAERTALPRVLRPHTWRANARDLVDVHDHVVWQQTQYPAIEAPTAIVTGSADRTVGPHIHSRALARQIPDARLTVLPGRGHMIHHLAPEAARAALDDVAARLEGSCQAGS